MYYPNKQPPQKTQPLMGGNPQMTVGGYGNKNPSSLGPTTAGPVSGTMAPNQGLASGFDMSGNPTYGGGYDADEFSFGNYGMGGNQGGYKPDPFNPSKAPRTKDTMLGLPRRQAPPQTGGAFDRMQGVFGNLMDAMRGQRMGGQQFPGPRNQANAFNAFLDSQGDPRNRSVQGPRDNSAYARLIAGRRPGEQVFAGSSPYDDRGEDDWRNLYANRNSLRPGSADWRRLVQGANSYNPSAQGASWANYKGTNSTLPTVNPGGWAGGGAMGLLNALNTQGAR